LLISDAFKVGEHTVINIYVFAQNKFIQYMVLEGSPSIFRQRIVEMQIPAHIKDEYEPMPDFRNI